jgi:lysophospholipase L1-like esterase
MQHIVLPDPRFLPLGRHDPKETQAHLWWSGSGVRLKTACTRLDIEVTSTCTDHAAYMGVLMDGAPVCRFPIVKGTRRVTALAGLDKGFAHEIAIIRDTQPSYDESAPVILDAIYTDGEIAPIEERPLLIEFIGDSLTVGEGTMGPYGEGQEWRMLFISHMPAFPTLVAEAMKADKRVVALGGWGAARSWDNQQDSRIGRIYGQLCGVTPGGQVPAPAEERPADAVVINLGTNDASALAGLGADELPKARAELRTRAVELMEAVRARYPRAVIVWAYGLCGHAVEDILRGAVEDVRAAGDLNAHYLSLSDAQTLGSRMHPSRDAHRRAAGEIADRLKQLLGLA